MCIPDLKPRLLVIIGPTGVGKSALALKIAEMFDGEIISADSMQVYRYMDIGTAKPDIADRKKVPHHLIDVVNPDENFNAAIYTRFARKIIEKLAHKKSIVVVGGTGLYIKTLVGGIAQTPAADEGLREYYRMQLGRFGKRHLYELLKNKDEAASRSIEPSDTFRVIRALEVWDKTGKSIVEQHESHRFEDRPYATLKIGLTMTKDGLYERIERRSRDMIKRGFIEEVKRLLERGYHDGLKSMQSLGYRHMTSYLQGGCSFADALTSMIKDTKRYAKRQMTWFAGDSEIQWFADHNDPEILKRICGFLT